jgi:PD-(D/E)XK nuclease superfamily
MPIEVTESLRVHDQAAFGKIAYETMQRAFQIHNDLGRFFEEDSYLEELAHVLGSRAQTEARIRVRHDSFCKTYFIDLLVGCCVIGVPGSTFNCIWRRLRSFLAAKSA